LLADDPPVISTPVRAKDHGFIQQLNSEGVTIIQVTILEKKAAYGSRIINLLDGRVENTTY